MFVPYKDALSFEIYVMDLVDAIKPESAEEMEGISNELHQCVENAILDSLEDEAYDFAEDYEPQY